MAWQDQYRETATFRDVPFFVDDADTSSGRRAQLTEFPLRDEPQLDDLGRRARRFELNAYVIGADYMAARDRLIEALEMPGPGLLVHPYHGEITVQIGEVSWSESTRNGGMCTFRIECWKATDAKFPTIAPDTQQQAATRIDAAQLACAAAFAETFSADGQPQRVGIAAGDLVQSAIDAIGAVASRISTVPAELTTLTGLVDRASSAVTSLVFAPAELADQLMGLVRQITVAAQRPFAAYEALRAVFGWGGDLDAVPDSTPSSAAQARNQAALVQLVQQLVTLEAARAASQSEFDSADDALGARDALIAQIDTLSEADIDDQQYQTLTAARAAVSRDLSDRGAQLPSLVRIELPASLPALTLAWALYADADRGDELVARNGLRDPLFVPSGVTLEALDE